MGLAEDLQALRDQGSHELATAADAAALEEARVRLLGRNGRFKELRARFAAESPEEKRRLGPLFNAADQALQEAFAQCQARLAAARDEQPIDVTLPAGPGPGGSLHPMSRIAHDVEAVFTSMGFAIVDGPQVETDEYNFARLNIPEDHPARDAQDTFWLSTGKLLRTHTSNVQAHVYQTEGAPCRKVVIGRVFRYEEVDATHDNTFTQVEGFLVDEGITVRHLVGILQTMLKGVLRRKDVETRLRPAFFPFVEPGFEVDVRVAGEPGRLGQWMELLGCGMVHPRVLAAGGIDPDRYSGFAFGMGLERLAMVRHGIDDIRLFHGADLRGLTQFGS